MSAQRDLIRRVRADLDRDPRVRGLWLTGSFGAGTSDEFSDVDMFVLVADETVESFAARWPDFAATYEPVLCRRLGAEPVFTHVLPGWLRWDVVIGGPAELAGLDAAGVRQLFNRDGLFPEHSRGGLDCGVDTAVVREIVEEFLRVLGLLPVVLGRGELVTAASGGGLLRQLTTTLLRYRAEEGSLSGALHLRRVLPAHEIAALQALPPAYAERDAVIRAHLACAAIFLPAAHEMLGADFPTDLERACWAHLRGHLDLTAESG
ncbi:MAG TPA: nucleotidyltransferase domain-containing protein [Nocardioidaceae bacterium]|nr:nucleotidyltransferase domain-containing protein [Nocardioidaceae bacterium]